MFLGLKGRRSSRERRDDNEGELMGTRASKQARAWLMEGNGMRLSGIGQSVGINDLCKANAKANWLKPEGVNRPEPQ